MQGIVELPCKCMSPEKDNIYDNVPAILPEELFECLIERENLKIERIISSGHATEEGQWYDQNRSEWVLLLKGEAIIRYEDGNTVTMKSGDFVNIPAHRRHRVEWTPPDSTTIWLAIHYEP